MHFHWPVKSWRMHAIAPKDWSETKRTMLGVGHCTTISGHFFDNYINSFHKTEVLTVILVSPTYKNLNLNQKLWHKSQFSFCFCFFNFVRKKNENLQLINCHFMTISGQFSANYNKIFHKTEVQTVILRCFVYLHLKWIKCNDIILVKIFFFHPWKCIISGLFC